MLMSTSRHALIFMIALGLLITGLLWQSNMASAQSIIPKDIADGLTIFTGAGANVVVHESLDSIVLIDGGSPEHSAALLKTVAKHFNNKPISALVNTHWHLEQTGSNDVLGASGVPIIAHENTRRWMTTNIEQHWNGKVFEPRALPALPSHTFYINDELQHGNQTIQLVHTPRSHTDGDIYAIFGKANVIVAGGIAYSGSYPILDTATNGWIGEMLDATRSLIKHADSNTIIVPANGDVLTLEDLLSQEEMLATLLERFQTLSSQGKGADDMLREGFADEYIEEWGDPTEFILTAWDGLWDHMSGLRAF